MFKLTNAANWEHGPLNGIRYEHVECYNMKNGMNWSDASGSIATEDLLEFVRIIRKRGAKETIVSVRILRPLLYFYRLGERICISDGFFFSRLRKGLMQCMGHIPSFFGHPSLTSGKGTVRPSATLDYVD